LSVAKWYIFKIVLVSLLGYWGSNCRALAKDISAEIKVYPSPGEPQTTSIEIFEPVAGILYQSIDTPLENTVIDNFHFEQKTDGILSCSHKQDDDQNQAHFCVMHMQQNGSLLPGTVANFDNSELDDIGARGQGEVQLRNVGTSFSGDMEITAQAAKALFLNLNKPEIAGIKFGNSLTCIHNQYPGIAESYQCSVAFWTEKAKKFSSLKLVSR
jgi:hypothetical protein